MKTMPYIEWIEERRSMTSLTEPAPNTDQIKQAIHCAMTAPDHRSLKPWRFIISSGKALQALGEVFLSSATDQAINSGEMLSDSRQERLLQMPLRAPLIITVVTCMRDHEKVPKFEQLLSAGACVQNLILALQAQGFSSIWRTGDLVNEPMVKAYFDVKSEDYIAGFIYVGSSESKRPDRKPVSVDDYLTFK